jgi:hypothetical protein
MNEKFMIYQNMNKYYIFKFNYSSNFNFSILFNNVWLKFYFKIMSYDLIFKTIFWVYLDEFSIFLKISWTDRFLINRGTFFMYTSLLEICISSRNIKFYNVEIANIMIKYLNIIRTYSFTSFEISYQMQFSIFLWFEN